MTFIGKMLIVVQLVLSLLFMAFAGAVFTVEQNWKQFYSDKDQDLKTEQDFHKSTQNNFNQYKNVNTAKVAELDTLSKKRLSDFTREKNRADNLQQQLNNLKTAHDTQRTVAQLEGDEAKFRRDESIEQRQGILKETTISFTPLSVLPCQMCGWSMPCKTRQAREIG